MVGKVGFIGLGNMGGPMALNLLKHGFSLVVHDIDAAKLEPALAGGASVAQSPQSVAAAVERTICMVETTAQAEAVIIGEHGIIQSAAPGHVVVCMSTIDPLAARRVAERLSERGVAMLDAPVSGGTVRAKSGELSVIVGGAAETYAACEDLFRAMGKNLFHVGELGHGLAMKLVNNMLGQVATVAIAEALVFGVKAGLDPQKIYEVIRVSTGTSVQFENRVPRMLRGDLYAGRHDRHFVQGPGSGDQLCQAARRTVAARQPDAAGLPDGASRRAEQGRRIGNHQSVRADRRRQNRQRRSW
jgi:3-hydroxyisobutyrate dehydrogenase-like beta-hydroxyacid dehydrogenase